MAVQEEKRLDGRTLMELRPFTSQQAVLKGPHGSARFSLGKKTSVLVSVSGPVEASLKEEKEDRAVISVRFNPLSAGCTDTLHTLYEGILSDIANHLILTSNHPRTIIQINVQVLADDGGILSCAINAMQLALMDAGIPMIGLASSITCCFDTESNLLLDPVLSELDEAQSIHLIATDSQGNIIASDSVGWINSDDYFSCLDICKVANEKVAKFIRLSVERKLTMEYGLDKV